MKKRYLLFVTVIICGLMILNGETVDIYPSDDMYTDVEHQGTPNAAGELWTANFDATGHYERIMLKFDLSNIDIAELTSAELIIHRFFSCGSGSPTSTDIYAISEDWNEDSWNVHQHAGYHENVSSDYVFQGMGGGTQDVEFTVDITNIAQYWCSDVGQNYGLVIAARSGSKFSKFYSKEYSNSSKHPVLRLTYADQGINDEYIFESQTCELVSYPNPFSNATTISYQANGNDFVNVDIYNILGQKVKTLFTGNTEGNGLNIVWNGTNSKGYSVPKGIYFCRIKGTKESITKKLILVK